MIETSRKIVTNVGGFCRFQTGSFPKDGTEHFQARVESASAAETARVARMISNDETIGIVTPAAKAPVRVVSQRL